VSRFTESKQGNFAEREQGLPEHVSDIENLRPSARDLFLLASPIPLAGATRQDELAVASGSRSLVPYRAA
jgi:hypothetical protein